MPNGERSDDLDGVRDAVGTLGLIVVNYGSHALLRASLQDVGASPDVHVVIVDNFSGTSERNAIRELAASRAWRLIELPVNLGFGAAVNRGARCATELGCTDLLLLNPDARLTHDALTALRRELSVDRSRAVSPRIVTSTGQVEYRGAQVSLVDGRIRSISRTAGDDGSTVTVHGQVAGQLAGPVQGWLTGACLGIPVELFERAGGFDEDYFLYWEDVDLSRRIERAGGRLAVLHHIQVVHDQGGTHGEPGARARSRTYYYYNCRNRLLFATKHLDRASVLRWILSTRRESWQILLRGGRRQLLSSTVPLRATVRGSLAGIGMALQARWRGPTSPSRPGSVLVAHPGAELYGSDRMVLETVDALVAAGREVTVALPGDGELVGELRRRGVRVEFCRVPVLRKSKLRPRGLVRLLADAARGVWPAVVLIRRFGPGGVYVNTVTIPSWLILSRLLRRPVVCHVHEAERSAPRLVRRVLALPALCADRVVVNSNYSLDVLSESLPRLRRRAEVVYNGIPGPPAPLPQARPEIVGAVRLLFVGRLSPRKGPDVAVAALHELAKRGVDARLDLVGSAFEGYAWFEQQLRSAAAAPELAGRVTLLGFENDVWPRLAGTDIALIPSVVDEPFGNTAVEALLAGRPAVVSATSGLREAAAGYGSAVFVPPDDPAALADAVEQIVRAWPHYVRAAGEDAELARQRHDPQHYRAAIVAAVTAAGRR